MKVNLAIATMISAAAILVPAHAATLIFPSNGAYSQGTHFSLNGVGGYVSVWGYDNGLPGTVTTNNLNHPTVGGTQASGGLYVQTDGSGVKGLGINNGYGTSNHYVAPTDYLLLDFSNVANWATSQPNQIKFGINIDATEPAGGQSYWVMYGVTNTNGNKTYTLLNDGEMKNLGTVYADTTSIYNQYIVGIIGDCLLDINSVTLTYPTTPQTPVPEPGTFIMAGMAMVGLGITLKKRRQRS